MLFSWDSVKSETNLRKHGVRFEVAKLVFDDPLHITRQDRKSMNKIPESIRQELAALAAKPEHDIDFSDLPATTAQDWQGARRGPFYRPVKKQQDFRFPSFPRQRESSKLLKRLNTRFRGYDEFTGLAKVLSN